MADEPNLAEEQERTGPTDEPAAEPAPEAEEKDDLPANQIDVADSGTLKKKVTVTVSRERIDAKRNEMFGELSESAQVPGFRIGRAPRRLIEKRFGKEITTDVRNALVGEALGQAVEKAALKTVGEPEIDLDAIQLPEEGDLAFSFEVEVVPEFELPDLAGIPVRKPSLAIDEERIDAAIEQLRQGMARYEGTDGEAAEGDSVMAGAKVAVEGAEAVERHGLQLRVAPGQVEGLPLIDLGKELTGVKAGGSVTLTLDVPEAHPHEAWRGKKATVTIRVGEVRKRVMPEIDEEFAKQRGYESVAQFRREIAARLTGRLEIETRMAMRQQVRDYLLGHAEFELPAGVAQRHAQQVLQRRYLDLLQRGIPREKIDEYLTELQAAVEKESARDLKASFILARIVEDRKIEVGDGEVNARIAEMARQYNRRPERLRQELEADGSLRALQMQMTEEKAIDQLLQDAQVEEVAPEAVTEEGEGGKRPARKARKAEKAEKADTEEKAEKPERKARKAEKAEKAEKPQKKVARKTEKKGQKKADKKADR